MHTCFHLELIALSLRSLHASMSIASSDSHACFIGANINTLKFDFAK